MPTTGAQQRFFGADLARSRAGKPTKTGLSPAKLREMARKPKRERPRSMKRG